MSLTTLLLDLEYFVGPEGTKLEVVVTVHLNQDHHTALLPAVLST